MNLALFMLTFMLSGLYATESYSQTVRISLNMKNSTVKEVLKKIENCSEFTFFYNDEIIDVDKRVTLNAEDLSISDILTTILPNCSYTISNKNIIITVKEAGVHQQGKIVTGVVRDVNGEPVVGANVSVKGTTNGTITDMDGKFTLEGVSADSKLSVSYIGYMAQEIVVGNKGAFEIVLKDDTQALEEVVVVGYAAQKKVNLTGSVASLNFTDEKLSRPVTTIAASLSGMVAGVNVMNTSSQPNAEGSSILIRGVGTMNDAGPLILVDGMEMSLNEVNPNDVASISILKDAASCAIYGNRGANGVILVTTKRGSDGKINVTYSGKFSYQTPAKLIRQVTDYADYMEFVNEGYLNTNQAAKFSQSTINEWREAANNPNATNVAGIPNYVTHPNTDWYDVVYDPKWMQEHTISLTGAEKRTNYAISGTYLNNPGLVIESGVKKYYLRSDIESRVTDFLTVGMRAWGYNADQDRNNLGDMWGLNMQKVTPGVYPYYDGKYGGIETNEEDGQAGNPLLNMSNSYGYYKQNKYFVNPYIEVKFLKDFKFTANFYYDQFTNHHRWQPSDYKEQYSFNRTMTLSTPPTSTDMATYKVPRRHPQPGHQRRQHPAAGPGQQPALHDQRGGPVHRLPGDDVSHGVAHGPGGHRRHPGGLPDHGGGDAPVPEILHRPAGEFEHPERLRGGDVLRPRCGAPLPGQCAGEGDLRRHERRPVRRGVAQPVPLRHHAAPDDHHRQSGLCGGVRPGLRPGHERGDLLRRHRGLHPLCAAVHLAPEHPGPGHDPDADSGRRRRPHLRLPPRGGAARRDRQAHRPHRCPRRGGV